MAGSTPPLGSGGNNYIKGDATPIVRREADPKLHGSDESAGSAHNSEAPGYTRQALGQGGIAHTKSVVVDGKEVQFPEGMSLSGPGQHDGLLNITGITAVNTAFDRDWSQVNSPRVGDYATV